MYWPKSQMPFLKKWINEHELEATKDYESSFIKIEKDTEKEFNDDQKFKKNNTEEVLQDGQTQVKTTLYSDTSHSARSEQTISLKSDQIAQDKDHKTKGCSDRFLTRKIQFRHLRINNNELKSTDDFFFRNIHTETCFLYALLLDCLFSIKKFADIVEMHAEKIAEFRMLQKLYQNQQNGKSPDLNAISEYLSKFWFFSSETNCKFFKIGAQKMINYTIERLVKHLDHIQKRNLKKLFSFSTFNISGECYDSFENYSPKDAYGFNFFQMRYPILDQKFIFPEYSFSADAEVRMMREKHKNSKRTFRYHQFGEEIILKSLNYTKILVCRALTLQNLEKGINHPNLGLLRVRSAILYNKKGTQVCFFILKQEHDGKWYISNLFDKKEYNEQYLTKVEKIRSCFVFFEIEKVDK